MIRSATKFVSVLIAAAAVATSTPALAAPDRATGHVQAIAAKCCSGYVRAVINGQVKCLRAGEFCTHSADRQYRHYGFRCIRYYRNVHRYRLTYA
ncbi:MAG: hypothetical protein ACXVFQ_15925 [Solirubrobacteraceae bacterium]